MPDVAQWWGEDLQVSPTGDLLLVDGIALGEQRVTRRLLTNAAEYIWNTAYGAGLPQRIGSLLDVTAIVSIIRSQLYQEAVVARTPAPTITVNPTPNPGTFSVSIQYTDAQSGQQASVAFELSP
jgi:hypothetical protein